MMLIVTWTVVSLLLAFSATCNSQVTCLNNCPVNANCGMPQSSGLRNCTCNSGYRLNGNGQCEDIDECAQGSCGVLRLCQNSPGSYTCLNQCVTGYTWKNGGCVDIDECAQSPCGARRCQNSPGSYNCLYQCVTGYIWRGAGCVDIDECSWSPCAVLRLCQNSPGSYICLNQCVTGYTWNGARCVDTDGCDGDTPCSDNADCFNTHGSYFCTCKTGFSGDGITCADLDECLDPDDCDPNADCVNVPGSFSCICMTGFHGSGTDCTALPSTLSKLTDSPARLAGGITGGLVTLLILGFIVVLLVLRQRSCPLSDVVHGGIITGSGGEEMPTLMVTQDVSSVNRECPAQTDLPEYEQIENTTPADHVYLNFEDNSNNYSTLTTCDEAPNNYSRLFC